jgi:Asp-tRNA(Asn)/Glu-tRNA(Gln) amidotransferase A subunit family amidase
MLAPEEKLKLATKPYLIVTARFANGADTPRDFLERCLADLTALEPKIGAFVHLNLEGARAAADQSTRRWREGRQSSPIDGMPLGIKDIIETADMPTENGSPLFAGWRSERDGASVAALREAGAVIVGKTVTTEFAATEPRGTRNPNDLRRTPGGSSSGSAAAVAAGMLSAALGTQVIGSTIRPASYCGCIGFNARHRHQPPADRVFTGWVRRWITGSSPAKTVDGFNLNRKRSSPQQTRRRLAFRDTRLKSRA